MRLKTQILDDQGVRRAIIRISHEIIEQNKGTKNLCLIGIQRRGVPLANAIAETIQTVDNTKVSVGTLDITLYRDDLSLVAEHPIIKATNIPFNITGKNVVLVDDVLQTGRTIRAAIEAISELGRPKTIQLAVLIDRGHRELPIAANYTGKYVPTSRDEVISVNCLSIDGADSVDLYAI